jgi:hypothetical protein
MESKPVDKFKKAYLKKNTGFFNEERPKDQFNFDSNHISAIVESFSKD